MKPPISRKELATLQVIEERLGDYKTFEERRNALVAKWREMHPQAAVEQSSVLPTLIPLPEHVKRYAKDPDQIWFNDIYQVTVRFHKRDPVFDSDGGMVQLGINTHDGTARHDWREFQAIKNQLVGPEVESFELYPAESRLLDPSNYYSLWCFPGIRRIKVGFDGPREQLDADVALAPQRALPKE